MKKIQFVLFALFILPIAVNAIQITPSVFFEGMGNENLSNNFFLRNNYFIKNFY